MQKQLLMILALLCSQSVFAEWRLLYKNDRDGQAVEGDIDDLIDAVRQGLPIRIAWGAARPNQPESYVEHVAEADFVTVASGKNVFVQIPEHIGQTSYWDTDFQDFNTPEVVWRGLFGTTGRFMAVFYNRSSGETVRRLPQKVVMSWFAEMPDDAIKNPKKLFETTGD